MFCSVRRVVNDRYTSMSSLPENPAVRNRYVKGKYITYPIGSRSNLCTTPHHASADYELVGLFSEDRSRLKALVIEGTRNSNYVLAIDMSNSPAIFTKDGEAVCVRPPLSRVDKIADMLYDSNNMKYRESFESVYGPIPQRLINKYVEMKDSGSAPHLFFSVRGFRYR